MKPIKGFITVHFMNQSCPDTHGWWFETAEPLLRYLADQFANDTRIEMVRAQVNDSPVIHYVTKTTTGRLMWQTEDVKTEEMSDPIELNQPVKFRDDLTLREKFAQAVQLLNGNYISDAYFSHLFEPQWDEEELPASIEVLI